MPVTNDLLDLRREIADAREALDRAGRIASRLAVPDPGRPAEVWPEMDALADQLAHLFNSFAGLVPDGVLKAFAGAEETVDHWGDQADAASL